MKCLEVAANADSGNRDACLWYARALRAAARGKRRRRRMRCWSSAIPDDAVVLAEYGAAQALAGDYTGARATFAHLLALNPSVEDRRAIAAWNKALDGLSTRDQLEPTARLRTGQFELCYDENDGAMGRCAGCSNTPSRARKTSPASSCTAFACCSSPPGRPTQRYATVFLPGGTALHAAAFTLPGVLVLWSPSDWPQKSTVQDEFTAILRHEMVHLALYQHTGGESFPTWLNEGIACYFGGWGGMQSRPDPRQTACP